jgi:hypothetical protein
LRRPSLAPRYPSAAFREINIPSMKTQAEFRSSKFPPCEGEEEQINPGLWGKRLAEYLVAKLAEKGIATDEMIAEDWGWYLPVRNDAFRLAVCCGHQDGDPDEFLCFTDPSTPIVKKWFKKIDVTAELTRLTAALHDILSSDPDIRDLVWTQPG